MSIDKVKAIARENFGKELTDEQAAKYAEKYGKLSDDELNAVAGGCGVSGEISCPNCNSLNTAADQSHGRYFGYECVDCGHRWQEI